MAIPRRRHRSPDQRPPTHAQPRTARHLSRLDRNTILMDLAAQIPATVLSNLLNLYVGTTAAWNERAGNTRAGYAAELTRRRPPTTPTLYEG